MLLWKSNVALTDRLFQVKEVKFSVEDLSKKANDLDQLAASGNVKETANVVATIATVLNEQKAEEKSADDIEESKKVHAYTGMQSFMTSLQGGYSWLSKLTHNIDLEKL